MPKRAATPAPSAASADASCSAKTLLQSIRARTHDFTKELPTDLTLVSSKVPRSYSVEYLMVHDEQTPVFKVTGTAIVPNTSPSLVPTSKSQHAKMDKYLVRVSRTSQHYAAVVANLDAIKEIYVNHPHAVSTIVSSNNMSSDSNTSIDIYGLRTTNELLFTKGVAGPTETTDAHPLTMFLPDPNNVEVQHFTRPAHFYLKPMIPLLNETTAKSVQPSVALDREVTIYFQVIQHAFNNKIVLAPEIVAVTTDPSAPEPPTKIARKSLFI